MKRNMIVICHPSNALEFLKNRLDSLKVKFELLDNQKIKCLDVNTRTINKIWDIDVVADYELEYID